MSIRFVLIFSLIIVGLTAGVFSQNVITRTRTSTVLETMGGTTITTTILVEGGERTITMVIPGYVLIDVRLESGRTCVVVFRALREIPEQTVTIEGGTFEFPGTTLSTVIREQTVVFSTAYTDSGWTTTYTGAGPGYATTILGYATTFPALGELRETCGENIISLLNTVIFETAPATFYLAFPGYTVTISAATYTIPGITMEIEPFTTTYTSTIEGVSETLTTTFRGSTTLQTVTLQPSTYVSTMVKEGSTVTRLVTVVETVTLEETTTPPATTTTPTTTATQTQTTQTATTTPQVTTRTETQPQPAQFDVAIIAIVLVVLAVVAGAVVYILKRKR